jgi:hypothetical protein
MTWRGWTRLKAYYKYPSPSLNVLSANKAWIARYNQTRPFFLHRKSLQLWTSWKLWSISCKARSFFRHIMYQKWTEPAVQIWSFLQLSFSSYTCRTLLDDGKSYWKKSKVYMRSKVRGFDGIDIREHFGNPWFQELVQKAAFQASRWKRSCFLLQRKWDAAKDIAISPAPVLRVHFRTKE